MLKSISALAINQTETGKHIKQLVDERGYNLGYIRSLMGLSSQAIYKWYSGQTLPSVDNLLILSNILDVSMEDILVIGEDRSFHDE